MTLKQYDAQKAAEAKGSRVKPGATGPQAPPVPPTIKTCPASASGTCNFAGTPTEANCGCSPSDNNGAASASQIGEVTNSEFDVYSLATNPPSNVKSVSLNSFFGYANNLIFDPRIMYDALWNRWIISAEGAPEGNLDTSPQYQFLGVSTTSDATGGFFIYQFNVNLFADPGHFYDYPQIGMNQDGLVITANHFNNAGVDAWAYGIAKGRVYNGQGFSVPLFSGLIPTVTPSITTPFDQSNILYLLSAANNDSKLTEYKFLNPQSAYQGSALINYGPIPVPAYTIPPKAPQNNGNIIDTGDNRFVNDPTQRSGQLYAVHTVALGSFPAPYWYQINAANKAITIGPGALENEGFFFQSGSSYDWNASVVNDTNGQVLFTWTSNDPVNSTGPGVSFGGRGSGSDGGTVGVAPQAFVGAEDTDFTCTGGSGRGCRWGDTSSVVQDLTNGGRVWLVNGYMSPGNVWQTRIVRVGY